MPDLRSVCLPPTLDPAPGGCAPPVDPGVRTRGGRSMAETSTSTELATYCPLCVSRCGATATVIERDVHAESRSVAPDREGAVHQGQGGAGDHRPPGPTPVPDEAHQPEGFGRPRLAAHQLGRGARHRRRPAPGSWPVTTARSRWCSVRCRPRRRRSSTASTGSSDCSGRSAARTSWRRWSCAAGAATSRRCTPTGRRCPASTCPTSTAPSASCSGATTRRCPGSPTRPRRGRRCTAAPS